MTPSSAPDPSSGHPPQEAPNAGIWDQVRGIQAQASTAGFDWDRLEDILVKLDEEVGELREAQQKGEPGAILDELGDVLFVVSHYAWRAGHSLEDALARALAKFELRWGLLCRELEEEGVEMRTQSVAELEARWQGIKRKLSAGFRPSPPEA